MQTGGIKVHLTYTPSNFICKRGYKSAYYIFWLNYYGQSVECQTKTMKGYNKLTEVKKFVDTEVDDCASAETLFCL